MNHHHHVVLLYSISVNVASKIISIKMDENHLFDFGRFFFVTGTQNNFRFRWIESTKA